MLPNALNHKLNQYFRSIGQASFQMTACFVILFDQCSQASSKNLNIFHSVTNSYAHFHETYLFEMVSNFTLSKLPFVFYFMGADGLRQ